MKHVLSEFSDIKNVSEKETFVLIKEVKIGRASCRERV